MDGGDLSGKGISEGGRNPYRVLARKYRPRSFDDLIGQEPMVRTLKNAFETGRIAQAYMLTGVRGVGKTTTARILARALNYLVPGKAERPTIDMPELGQHCAEIMEGRHIDVIEMDAASHTGIGDIREIIEAVRYKPVSARYKVYIIDEVHMLSTAAFNGLLKTLEEPPEHVKFIFATTEIRKVPITVLSRCQRFDLRRIEAGELMGLLGRIAAKEEIGLEDGALAMIARAAEGSARDSLSLLDQAIAHGAGTIRTEDVRAMLGLADRARIVDLFEAVMAGRIAEALALLKELYDVGAEPLVVLQDLAAFTHLVTRLKVAPAVAEDGTLPEEERHRGRDFAASLSLRVLARTWQMLLKGIEEVGSSNRPLAAADMVLVRISHAADLPTPDEALRLLKESGGPAGFAAPSGGGGPAMPSSGGGGGPVAAVGGAPARAFAPEAVRAPVAQLQPAKSEPAKTQPALRFARFEDLVAYVGNKRDIALKLALEQQVRPIRFEQGFIEVELTADASPALATDLARKLSDWAGERWVVALGRGATAPTIQEARDAQKAQAKSEAQADPLVAAVLSRFPGAKVVDVQIRGSDDDAAPEADAAESDMPDAGDD